MTLVGVGTEVRQNSFRTGINGKGFLGIEIRIFGAIIGIVWVIRGNKQSIATRSMDGATNEGVGSQGMYSPVGNAVEIQVRDAEGNIELLSELVKGLRVAHKLVAVAISPVVYEGSDPRGLIMLRVG